MLRLVRKVSPVSLLKRVGTCTQLSKVPRRNGSDWAKPVVWVGYEISYSELFEDTRFPRNDDDLPYESEDYFDDEDEEEEDRSRMVR